MTEIKKLLKSQKYDEAIIRAKSLLNENESAELWYLLFLACNGDYINTDFNNINNELAFNKALELDEKKIYIVEYNFYKTISKIGMHKIFRSAQLQYFDNIVKYVDDIDNLNYKFTDEEASNIVKQIIYMNKCSSFEFCIDLFYVLLNVLYLKTKSSDILEALDNLDALLKSNPSGIRIPPKLHNDTKYLKKKIRCYAGYFNCITRDNPFLAVIESYHNELLLLDGYFAEVIEKNKYTLKYDYYNEELFCMFLASNKFHCKEDLFECNSYIDLSKNEYFNLLISRDTTYKDYLNKALKHMSDLKKYYNAIKRLDYNDYKYLKSLNNYLQASKYALEFEMKLYNKALALIDEKKYLEANDELKKIIDFKDAKDLIKNNNLLYNEELKRIALQKKKKTRFITALILIALIAIGLIIFLL